MKYKLIKTFVFSVLAIASTANGAITVSIKDFTSATVGVPVVDANGAAVAKNTIFASAGIFTSTIDWNTATATTILAAFKSIDSTPLTNGTFTGLFTGNDTSTLAAYASGFEGTTPYIVVGNNSTLLNSTSIAVYKAVGTVYATPVAGVANTAVNGTNIDNWVFGIKKDVTVQPATLAGAAFSKGIQLTDAMIPETSTALLGALGALGLLRRRR